MRTNNQGQISQVRKGLLAAIHRGRRLIIIEPGVNKAKALQSIFSLLQASWPPSKEGIGRDQLRNALTVSIV